MKKIVLFIFTLFCSASGFATEPLKLKKSVKAERNVSWVSASRYSPFVLLKTDEGYWLFNAETFEQTPLAESFSLLDDSPYKAFWDGNKVMVVYLEKQMKRFALDGSPPEVIPMENSLALRAMAWFPDTAMLIDHVNPYVLEDGKLVEKKLHWSRRHHLPMQSGLVRLDESRYVTAGYQDQTLVIWSLPDGKELKRWQMGRWYSSYKITHLAVVDGRLLVATDNGLIQEISPDTGKPLWSLRQGGSRFHYSSHYQQIDSESFFFTNTSINTPTEIHFTYGKRFGTLWRTEGGWQTNLDTLKLSDNIQSVETLPGTSYVLLVLANGEVKVFDRQQRKILQSLKNTRPWGQVTYVPATKQIVLPGADGFLHLYELVERP